MPKLDAFGIGKDLNLKEWEEAITLEADHFSIVLYKPFGMSERLESKTLSEAVALTQGSPRAMIYAVHVSERHACIAPKDYERLLKLRGEKT